MHAVLVTAVGALLLQCATFPQAIHYQETLGSRYDVGMSRDGVVEFLRRVARQSRVMTSEERSATGAVTVTTAYIKQPDTPEDRRVSRVAYTIDIQPIGATSARKLLITISCIRDTRGEFERTWRREPASEIGFEAAGCVTTFSRALENELEQLAAKQPAK